MAKQLPHKLMWVEPKTGLIFDNQPRERNTYMLFDTPAVRRVLRENGGDTGALVAFCERQERKLKEAFPEASGE